MKKQKNISQMKKPEESTGEKSLKDIEIRNLPIKEFK